MILIKFVLQKTQSIPENVSQRLLPSFYFEASAVLAYLYHENQIFFDQSHSSFFLLQVVFLVACAGHIIVAIKNTL